MNQSQIIPKENGKSKKASLKGSNHNKGKVETIPFLHLKRKTLHGWDYSKKLTAVYLNCLEEACQVGRDLPG